MPFWYYFAGITPEGHGMGDGVLMEVTAGPSTETFDSEEMSMAEGFALQRFGVFDHEPTGDEKYELLPPQWQEEYADTRLLDDVDDDDEWDEDPAAPDVDELQGEAGSGMVGRSASS